MKQPIKMTPGDDLHLTALMAPFSLNLVTSQDRQHLLGYGRAAFDAGKASPCLHQIQEPAAEEQAAWHAGLDEGRAQAAPAAVAVPDLQDMLRELRVQIHKITVQLAPTSDCSGVWAAHDKMSAALAATPAAVAPVVLPEPDAAIKEVMDLVSDWGEKSHLSGEAQLDAHSPEATQSECDYADFCQKDERTAWTAIESNLRALLAGVSAPAALVDARCASCNYQHGHAIGCENNPVDIALKAQEDARNAQLLAFAVSEIRRDEMTDSELLDAMEQKRIAVVPEYEGPWDAEIYNDEGKPNHRGSGSTPREAIRAAIAAAKGE